MKHGSSYRVTADMKTGPSRNFAAPAGTVARTFVFPARWTKSGAVRIANHPDDYLLQRDGERAGILITDPKTAGVYDTVYVDLDGDHDFSDEKPVTKASPASYRDIDHDGFTDVSGGLLYYISDGVGGSPVPGGLEEIFGLNVTAPSGAILAWTGDFDPAIEGHGTLTASNVAGQGVVNGLLPRFRDLPGNGRPPAAVVGGAPDTKLVPFGDIYFAFEISTQIGYILGFNAGVDVLSNSYGSSEVDNDGLDAASQEADFWNNAFGNQSLSLFSTGNGAPGFGTTSPPSPATGMSVGASTQFSGTGWDSIKDYSQVVDNDVIEWSNRGPGANGTSGVDIVADGAYAPGDATLNSVGDGSIAWASWGGTSRSTPVAAGAAALVYQAWRESRGTSPNAFDVRSTLMSSAKDLDYQSFIQGAGSLDAGRAVDLAKGVPGRVTPETWRPGAYAGQQWAAFPHVVSPGGSSEQQFSVEGGGRIKVSDRYLVRTDRVERTFTSSPAANESAYTFNAPDYLIDVSQLVKRHPNAELMVVRMDFDHSQLDPNGDYTADQAWRMLTYNWTDQDGDGRLWRDRDGDGVVDHVQLATSSNIDGNPDIDFAQVGDRQGRVRPLHVPPAGQQRPGQLRARPEGSDGGRHVHRPAAPAAGSGPAADRLQGPDRLLRHGRLAVAEDVGHGAGHVHGARRRAGGRSVRRVRRRDRGHAGQRPDVHRAGRPQRRRDGAAGGRRLAAGHDVLRRRGRRERAVQPAVQQRLRVRRPRLDVARRVGRLAVLLPGRPEGPAARHAVPRRHDVGRRGAAHRPRHGHPRPVREHVRARPGRSGRRAVHPRHGRRQREHEHQRPACGSSTRPPAATRRS